jgi:hypothetical protein
MRGTVSSGMSLAMEYIKMFYWQDTWVLYEEALCQRCLSAKKNNQDFEKMSAIEYKGNIDDYIIQKSYYNIK